MLPFFGSYKAKNFSRDFAYFADSLSQGMFNPLNTLKARKYEQLGLYKEEAYIVMLPLFGSYKEKDFSRDFAYFADSFLNA